MNQMAKNSMRQATASPLLNMKEWKTNSVRFLMRRHLNMERIAISKLAAVWNQTEKSAYRRFYHPNPFPPAMIEAFANLLKLDEFDRCELHKQAAREAGYLIDGPELDNAKKKE